MYVLLGFVIVLGATLTSNAMSPRRSVTDPHLTGASRGVEHDHGRRRRRRRSQPLRALIGFAAPGALHPKTKYEMSGSDEGVEGAEEVTDERRKTLRHSDHASKYTVYHDVQSLLCVPLSPPPVIGTRTVPGRSRYDPGVAATPRLACGKGGV